MGNDLQIIKPADSSILSNPAIIAINQDPMMSAAARRCLYSADEAWAPQTITQMWSGPLTPTTNSAYNDMVVILVNGAS